MEVLNKNLSGWGERDKRGEGRRGREGRKGGRQEGRDGRTDRLREGNLAYIVT